MCAHMYMYSMYTYTYRYMYTYIHIHTTHTSYIHVCMFLRSVLVLVLLKFYTFYTTTLLIIAECYRYPGTMLIFHRHQPSTMAYMCTGTCSTLYTVYMYVCTPVVHYIHSCMCTYACIHTCNTGYRRVHVRNTWWYLYMYPGGVHTTCRCTHVQSSLQLHFHNFTSTCTTLLLVAALLSHPMQWIKCTQGQVVDVCNKFIR